MVKSKRGVTAVLWRGKAQENHVPSLKEMSLEANCRGPFRGVKNFGKHEHDAKFMCTACGRNVPIVEVRAHPLLHVGIYKNCHDFQISDPFTKDNPQDPFFHENECRWCGDGGDVVLCDSCPKVFCKYCIKRNFGEEILNAIELRTQEWFCFVCHDDHLQIVICDHLQTLIHDYNNMKNLVKTMNRSDQPQKSGSEGHSDVEENINNYPHFYKTLAASNTARFDRNLVWSNTGQFELPKKFMDRYNKQVEKKVMSIDNKLVQVKFQGINKDSPVYDITCKKRCSENRWRAHLRPSEWSVFVKDNGLQKGHELQFSLVADS